MKKQNKLHFNERGFTLQAICILFLVLIVLLCTSCEREKTNEDSISEVFDQSKILFSTDRNGHNELYRFENNQEILLLSDPNYDYWWPKVSPDKSKILVYRSAVNPEKNHDDYQEAELLLVDLNGENAEVLIEKGKHGWSGQGVARWNRDGSKILMIAEQNTTEGNQWRMVITDARGNNPQNLSEWWIIDPNFSIDNKSIVFMGFPNNDLSFNLSELELHQADFDAVTNTISNISRLTNNNTRDHDPSFSPDGKDIIFSAGNVAYNNVDMTIYNTEAEAELKILDDSGANGGSMCWSLDGANIYFHSVNLSKHSFQIKRINMSSLEVTTLLSSGLEDYGYYHPEAY